MASDAGRLRARRALRANALRGRGAQTCEEFGVTLPSSERRLDAAGPDERRLSFDKIPDPRDSLLVEQWIANHAALANLLFAQLELRLDQRHDHSAKLQQ